MVKTNDLKKGTRIRLANGWEATLMDNAKGNIRMAEVEGYFTEIGSVYSHDIVEAKVVVIKGGCVMDWRPVEHTPAQLKLKKAVGAMGL